MKPRLVLLAGLCTVGACVQPAPHSTGVYLLVDTSGSYNRNVTKTDQIILYALSRLQSEDSIAVARIDTGSFTERDIIAKATFDDRPSTANAQKRAFASRVEKFIDGSSPAPYTDITGGMLQAIEYLNEKRTARKEILILSDMKEDLAKGYVRDVPLDLHGFDVVALNVTKLRSDNFDPRLYLGRLDAWRARVEKGGGHWRVVNDIDHLTGLL
ncbi:MAG TPA: vWA domain-containing protein [Steroidobacteraceae bacterium]|nr:vWA domain-containing protein [Steroidobacteraceae bacterium]